MKIGTVILGGGSGSRLFPLTKDRAKPSVPIGGKFRIIDFALSNCIHSELDEIFILTQFNSASLNRHIYETYHFGSLSSRSVRILAAQQTPDRSAWYQGTADAVRQNLPIIVSNHDRPDHILILAGDHIYRMDYRKFIALHIEKDADLTISAIPVRAEEASRFGILRTDREGRVRAFVEKPSSDKVLEPLASKLPSRDNAQDPASRYLASMGIYIFKTDVLIEKLSDPSNVDFGKHVMGGSVETNAVYACPFDGYWEDIGTIRSYYEASLGLLETVPRFDFYNESAPIYTYRYHLPGTKINESRIRMSYLAEGAIIDRSEIVRSIIGLRSVIGADTRIENSLIMGANCYQSAEQIAADQARSVPRMGIGRRCVIRGAIIDKNAHVGDDVTLVNRQAIQELDAEHYYIRDYLVIVPRSGVVPSGTVV